MTSREKFSEWLQNAGFYDVQFGDIVNIRMRYLKELTSVSQLVDKVGKVNAPVLAVLQHGDINNDNSLWKMYYGKLYSYTNGKQYVVLVEVPQCGERKLLMYNPHDVLLLRT